MISHCPSAVPQIKSGNYLSKLTPSLRKSIRKLPRSRVSAFRFAIDVRDFCGHPIVQYDQDAKAPVYPNPDRPYRWQVNFLHSEWPKLAPKSMLKTARDRDFYKIYEHFTLAGYWLTTGLQYGVDFLAYRGSPELYHSECIVYCVEFDAKISTERLMQMTRIGSKTNKKLVLASVDKGTVVTTAVTWSTRGWSPARFNISSAQESCIRKYAYMPLDSAS